MLFGQRENTGVEPKDMLEAAELRKSTSTPVLDIVDKDSIKKYMEIKDGG